MRACHWLILALLLTNAISLYQLARRTQPEQPASNITTSTPQAVDATTAPAVQQPDPADKFGPIIARANGKPVRQFELLPYLHAIMPVDAIDKLARYDDIPAHYIDEAVRQYAVDSLIVDIAQRQGMADDIRLLATRQYAGRQLVRKQYLNSVRKQLVSEQQVHQQYNEMAEKLKQQTETHARHILLATKKEADVISRALDEKKRSFDELAKLFSLDNATSYKGGDLGYHINGQLNPTFEREIAKLPLHTWSQPFQTELGWHIAVVEDRRAATVMSYEQAAPLIRERLEQQAMAHHTQELAQQVRIELLAANSEHPVAPADSSVSTPPPPTTNQTPSTPEQHE